MPILKLALFGLANTVIALVFYFLYKKTKFGNIKNIYRQIIVGIVFGGLAVLCTEFGVKFNNSILNVRDAAPITAALIFGWPAGVIAGFIGGLERFFSTYWNGSYFTQIACSISTFVSGCVAGLLNKFLFKSKRPRWFQALAIGMVLETSHILMIFITNMNDVSTAFQYVEAMGNIMIVAVGLSVMHAVLVINLIGMKDFKKPEFNFHRPHIAVILHLLLFTTVAFAYANVAIFTRNLQDRISQERTNTELKGNVDDVVLDIVDNSNKNLLSVTFAIADNLEARGEGGFDNGYLSSLIDKDNPVHYNVSEICYVNPSGVISVSSNLLWLGMEMNDGGQAGEFYDALILGDAEYYVQNYGPISKDSSVYMKFAAKRMSFGGFVQVGYDSQAFYADLQEIIGLEVKNRRVGENGIMIIADENENIVGITGSTPEGELKPLSSLGFDKSLADLEDYKTYSASISVNGKVQKVRYQFADVEGYYVIGIMLQSEIEFSANMSTYVSIYLEFIIFAVVFFVIYMIVNRYVIQDLAEVNNKLDEITNGNLDVDINVNSTEEFAYLSNSINSTVGTMKELINKEAERINAELALAKDIQLSALPTQNVFLNFHQFAVYATMKTAKEVGGDFYDYFPLDNHRFAIIIADVSGKGIPAALFMMRTKTLIKSLLENGLSVNETLNRANENLCEGNDAKMFVTCWLGVINVDTGVVEYANAGHNPPLIKHNGQFEYLHSKVNFILGALPITKYTKQTLELAPGDAIFLYTDGITEATIGDNQFYGEERLKEYANTLVTNDPMKITNGILQNTLEFTGEHEQSDDMTLLTFCYFGETKHERLSYDGKVSEFPKARDDMMKYFKDNNVSQTVIDKFVICLEEIFVNVASYGYKDKEGPIVLYLDVSKKRVELTVIDAAPQFNPLDNEDPDITADAKDRRIGGLGIFMVKNMMDRVIYAYLEKHNCLSMSVYLDDLKEK